MKLKHPLDWYNENTPSEDEEYEKGCLSIALIVVIINGCNFILRIMKSKQVLSIEQMKHLQELGLDTSDASMCWCRAISHKSVTWELEIYEYVINQKLDSNFWETTPTYTLQDILDKLPKRIETEDYEFELYIYYHENGVSVFYDDGDITQLAFFSKPTLLESAYEMLCWCIENGYVKVGKEE